MQIRVGGIRQCRADLLRPAGASNHLPGEMFAFLRDLAGLDELQQWLRHRRGADGLECEGEPLEVAAERVFAGFEL